MLKVNERQIAFHEGMRLIDLVSSLKPKADLFIINGYPVSPLQPLQDGDSCWLIKKGEIPPADELNRLLHARHTPGVQERVCGAVIGVMGLGGLGSMVAGAMTRIGVGRLILADYDIVDPTNLNRQQYYIDQIGMKKTLALKHNMARINPHVQVDTVDVKLTGESIVKFFKDADVLAECFDQPGIKAQALRTVLTSLKGIGYVGSSGVAGYGDNNAIHTKKLKDKVYIVGDGVSAAGPGSGLMAPRVGIAAHHQANQILRILLGEG